ncbi:MAG: carboxypeptidase-like regulatory domain-containing protein [Euryarchaeota archaeon]|nr:carboxypeptidase-like regulatory domain-containing protein [Euryarchaeota archaeon]
MPKVSTFCPRCGETIETDVPDAARVEGRAEVDCPACKFSFMIAPARARTTSQGQEVAPPEIERPKGPPPGDVDEGSGQRPPIGAAPTTAGPPGGRAGFGGGGGGVRSMKPVAAAIILFFVAVFDGYMGLSFLLADDLLEDTITSMEGPATFDGLVTSTDGEPLGGVTITLVEAQVDTNRTGTMEVTNDTGRYAFEGIEPGIYTFRYEAMNHTTLLYKVPVFGDELGPLGELARVGDVELEPGEGEETRSMVEEFRGIQTGLGWVIIIIAVVVTAAGVAALKRRAFPLAVTGSVLGMIMLLNLIAAGLSLIALVLVLMSRKEFFSRKG